MKREEDFRSVLGKAAWLHYKLWMKINRRSAPKPESFITSRYFNTFMSFAKFVKQVCLPDVERFIRLQKQQDIPPTMWTCDEIYERYTEYLDFKMPPAELVSITIGTLWDIADAGGVDISAVFECITPNEVIQLLRQRRLSPWLLMKSPKFIEFYTESTTGQERVILETLIKPDHWREQFEKHPEMVKKIPLYIAELKL